MQNEIINKLQNHFDALAQKIPGEEIEFWFARDLQEPLGYLRWENFMAVIQKAIASCQTTSYDPNDHFRGVTKMVSIGSDSPGEHVQNNLSVRDMLEARGIKPENLLPEEDVLKLERRVKSEEKKLVKQSGKLPKLGQA